MRKVLFFLTFAAVTAQAQGRVYPERRAFITVGDGIATGMGGVLNGTTFMQVMRGSIAFRIAGMHGIDVMATRMQTIFPPTGTVNDYEHTNPEGDAIILSWAQFSRTRARGIPSELTLGLGVVRRNTSEAGRTRDTWIGRFGYDTDPFARWSRGDAAVGFNAFLMPANNRNLVYVATLGLVIRIG